MEASNREAEDYAMTLNHTAQLQTGRAATKLMLDDGRIVFVTSHWAHHYGQRPVIPGYEVVAKSERGGEEALRDYASGLNGSGISLVAISGGVIEVRLLSLPNGHTIFVGPTDY